MCMFIYKYEDATLQSTINIEFTTTNSPPHPVYLSPRPIILYTSAAVAVAAPNSRLVLHSATCQSLSDDVAASPAWLSPAGPVQ